MLNDLIAAQSRNQPKVCALHSFVAGLAKVRFLGFKKT